MESETIESIITNEPSFRERFMEAPASTLVEEVTQMATNAVHGAAESINSEFGIHGETIYHPSYHWFGYAVLAGLAVAAAYGVKKAIDHYKNTDKYVMKSMKRAYERCFPNHRKRDRHVKKKIAGFNSHIESLFSDFNRTEYQNKALRMVMEGVMQSDNPYDTIRNIRAALRPGMTGSDIVNAASKVIPNGAEVKAAYDTRYQSVEAFDRKIARNPA
ncbi:hypothetical protein KY360_04400 [Candidatus Woesearchaeota archaeon]|nr:hypothetical protein [Candidatus Woesearchaeota archaeon]